MQYLTIKLSVDSARESLEGGGESLTLDLFTESGAEVSFDTIIPPMGADPSCTELWTEGAQALNPGKTPTPPPILATRQTKHRI